MAISLLATSIAIVIMVIVFVQGVQLADLCTDNCVFAHNADCEDGGSDAIGNLCEYGDDCDDCGPRPENPGFSCWNTCHNSDDGFCDDGGDDADYSECSYATDCLDCGPRLDAGPEMCFNTCEYNNDGECDDGGVGAAYSGCYYGTDCLDCGIRNHVFDPPLCDDSCSGANDSSCEDGGLFSTNYECYLGTDCTDCGIRGVLPSILAQPIGISTQSTPTSSPTNLSGVTEITNDDESTDASPKLSLIILELTTEPSLTSSGTDIYMIIGLVVGSLVGVMVVTAGVLLFTLKKKQTRSDNKVQAIRTMVIEDVEN